MQQQAAGNAQMGMFAMQVPMAAQSQGMQQYGLQGHPGQHGGQQDTHNMHGSQSGLSSGGLGQQQGGFSMQHPGIQAMQMGAGMSPDGSSLVGMAPYAMGDASHAGSHPGAQMMYPGGYVLHSMPGGGGCMMMPGAGMPGACGMVPQAMMGQQGTHPGMQNMQLVMMQGGHGQMPMPAGAAGMQMSQMPGQLAGMPLGMGQQMAGQQMPGQDLLSSGGCHGPNSITGATGGVMEGRGTSDGPSNTKPMGRAGGLRNAPKPADWTTAQQGTAPRGSAPSTATAPASGNAGARPFEFTEQQMISPQLALQQMQQLQMQQFQQIQQMQQMQADQQGRTQGQIPTSPAGGNQGQQDPKQKGSKLRNPKNPWADVHDAPHGTIDQEIQQMWAIRPGGQQGPSDTNQQKQGQKQGGGAAGSQNDKGGKTKGNKKGDRTGDDLNHNAGGGKGGQKVSQQDQTPWKEQQPTQQKWVEVQMDQGKGKGKGMQQQQQQSWDQKMPNQMMMQPNVQHMMQAQGGKAASKGFTAGGINFGDFGNPSYGAAELGGGMPTAAQADRNKKAKGGSRRDPKLDDWITARFGGQPPPTPTGKDALDGRSPQDNAWPNQGGYGDGFDEYDDADGRRGGKRKGKGRGDGGKGGGDDKRGGGKNGGGGKAKGGKGGKGGGYWKAA